MLSGFCPPGFGVLLCSLVLGCRYTLLTTGPCSQSWPCMLYKMFLKMCMLSCIQAHKMCMLSCVCFIRSSGVTRCTLLMVLYLDHMCQCWLHAVLWSHNGTLMHRLAAEPRSATRFFYSPLGVPLERSCYYNPVFDGVGLAGFKSRANDFLFD